MEVGRGGGGVCSGSLTQKFTCNYIMIKRRKCKDKVVGMYVPYLLCL